MLTAYCLSYGHYTPIPKQWRESFLDMRDLGFDAVALSFSESEMRYSRRAFELQIAAAHEAGLKVFVVPSRLGGRFAGAPLMTSLWLTLHPECQVPGHPDLSRTIGWFTAIYPVRIDPGRLAWTEVRAAGPALATAAKAVKEQ